MVGLISILYLNLLNGEQLCGFLSLNEDSPLRGQLYPLRSHASGPEDMLYHYDKILVECELLENTIMPATILRLPMVYGPGDPQHRIRP